MVVVYKFDTVSNKIALGASVSKIFLASFSDIFQIDAAFFNVKGFIGINFYRFLTSVNSIDVKISNPPIIT